MVGSLTRRERRPLWSTACVILAAGIGLALWMAFDARNTATRHATDGAELAAQTELAPLLQPRDLMAPMSDERAEELTTEIGRIVTSSGEIEGVRLYSAIGRILYAEDQSIVGTRPSYLRDIAFEVSNGGTRSMTRSGQLQTFVPIWLTPGGTVAVAELSQPIGPIAAAATADWFRIAMIAGALLLGSAVMVIATTRAGAQTRPAGAVYLPAIPRRESTSALRPAPADAPLYLQPGFRAIEEQRQEATRRAEAAEENFRATQKQLKETLAQVRDLEGRLAMNETQSSTHDGEVTVLREQLRETSERLHKAELDNNQMRERMALRQQELDEARHLLAGSAPEGDVEEMRRSLDAAERRVVEVTRAMEKLEAELDYTKSKFHMTKLSEALREFDNDELEIEEDDDLFEHPVIIRNRPGIPTTHKVR